MSEVVRLSELQESGEVILLQDRSMSMELVPEFVAAWNRFVETLPEAVRITLYSVNAKVVQLCRQALPANVPKLSLATWYEGPGGALERGTHLREAIVVAGKYAVRRRKDGFVDPLGLLILTDGFSTGDRELEGEARDMLELLRYLGIRFALIAFIEGRYKEKLEALIADLKIGENEIHPVYFEAPERRTDSMRRALNTLGEEVHDTTEMHFTVNVWNDLGRHE